MIYIRIYFNGLHEIWDTSYLSVKIRIETLREHNQIDDAYFILRRDVHTFNGNHT